MKPKTISATQRDFLKAAVRNIPVKSGLAHTGVVGDYWMIELDFEFELAYDMDPEVLAPTGYTSRH